MAKKTIKKTIYNEELEKTINKKVLLFSGGLDSWITMKIWKPDVLLYIMINHKAQKKELQSIQSMTLPVPIMYDRRLSLQKDERLDAIIPLRNLYFTMIASRYGDHIGIGVLHGEVNSDKSYSFRKQAGKILSLCYSRSYWSQGRTIDINYPISHLTKAEAIKEYLRRRFSKDELIKTRSCYANSPLPCGICSNCVKRYIAFTLNNIHENYEHDPRESPFVEEFKKRFSSYDSKRQKEFLAVFKN